jgi:Secretion system C-terminal sorting domain
MRKKLLLYLSLLLFQANKLNAGNFIVTTTANTGAGSLRTAITNVNASVAVKDTITFNIPTSNGGYSAVTGVFTITISTALPELKKSGVLIDGYTQTAFTGNTNTATFRSKITVGTGLDAIEGTADDPVFPAIAGAEVQIISTIATNALRKLVIVGKRNTVRGIAFRNVRLLLKGNTDGLVQACTFGINANSFTNPGSNYITSTNTSDEGSLAIYDSTANLVIKNNLFAYANQRGVFIIDANWNYNLQIIENEVAFTNRLNNFFGGGIEIAPILTPGTSDSTSAVYKIRKTIIARNLIHDAKATAGKADFGIEINLKESSFALATTNGQLDSLLIENNNIYENNNGVVFSKMGVSSVGNIFRYNIINNNGSHGLYFDNRYVVGATNYVTSPLQCAISKNSFYNNGQLGIDLVERNITTPASSAGSVNANDNGDVDNGSNTSLNFPILTSCYYTSPATIQIEGFSVAGAIVEIYAADNNTIYSPLYATSPYPLPSGYTSPYGIGGYGEGKRFITSFQEGSITDLDATTANYNDDGTGVLGIRTENRWRVSIPVTSLPAGFDLLWRLTTTATDANGNTSEFGPSPTLSILPVYKQDFTAYLQNETVKLSSGNENTAILKKLTFQWSVNGVNWNDIAEIAALPAQQKYNYTHLAPANGNNYYRVKMILQDGNTAFSIVKLVKAGKNPQPEFFSVYPNPSNGRFTVSLPGITAANPASLLQVYDMKGALLITSNATLHNGDELNLQIPKGKYILRYTNTKNNETVSKIIIIL